MLKMLVKRRPWDLQKEGFVNRNKLSGITDFRHQKL